MINQEKEDLAALLLTPGWIRLTAHLESEWGSAAMERHYEQAAAIADPEASKAAIYQIAQRKKAVREMMAWPSERIKALDNTVATALGTATAFARGGYSA